MKQKTRTFSLLLRKTLDGILWMVEFTDFCCSHIIQKKLENKTIIFIQNIQNKFPKHWFYLFIENLDNPNLA